MSYRRDGDLSWHCVCWWSCQPGCVLVAVQLAIHGWAVLLTGRGYPSTASAVGAISARSPCLRQGLLAVHKLANRAKHAAFGAGPRALLSLKRLQRKAIKGSKEDMAARERIVISRQVQYVVIVVEPTLQQCFYDCSATQHGDGQGLGGAGDLLSSSEIDRDGDSTLDRVTLALRQARDPDSSRPPEDERAPPVEREPLCEHGETVGDGHVQGTDVVPACASLGVAGTTAKQRLAAYGWQKVLGLKGKPVTSSVSRMGRCIKSRRSRGRANAGGHNHCNDFEDQAANVEEWPVLRAAGCRAGLHILGCFLVGLALVLGWGGCSWESGGVGFGGQSITAAWPDDAARPLNPERGMAVSSAGMMDSETRERPMGGRSDPQGPAVGNGRAGPVTSRKAPRTQATGGKAKPGRAEGGLVGNEFARWLQAQVPSAVLSDELIKEAFVLADVDGNGVITAYEYKRAQRRLRDADAG